MSGAGLLLLWTIGAAWAVEERAGTAQDVAALARQTGRRVEGPVAVITADERFAALWAGTGADPVRSPLVVLGDGDDDGAARRDAVEASGCRCGLWVEADPGRAWVIERVGDCAPGSGRGLLPPDRSLHALWVIKPLYFAGGLAFGSAVGGVELDRGGKWTVGGDGGLMLRSDPITGQLGFVVAQVSSDVRFYPREGRRGVHLGGRGGTLLLDATAPHVVATVGAAMGEPWAGALDVELGLGAALSIEDGEALPVPYFTAQLRLLLPSSR